MKDSFSSMKKNHQITSHSCTQIMTRHYKNTGKDVRKTPINETKTPTETKYSKDVTKKDPYPWLD